MTKTKNTVVAVYKTLADVEAAVQEMQHSGFDIGYLSIVGRDNHIDEDVVGYYNTGDQMKYWGKLAGFWDGFWNLFPGSAFFVIPEVGPLLMAGPVVGWVVGALKSGALMSGLSAFGAGLCSVGIPNDCILSYQAAVSGGKYLVIAHGSSEGAAQIIRRTGAESMQEHPCSPLIASHHLATVSIVEDRIL